MITLPALSTLDPAAVAATQAYLFQRVGELIPDTERRRGPVHDLVLFPHAAVGTAYADAFDRLRRSMSLSAVAEDPSLADEDTVDAILSNAFITRDPGTKATGRIVLVISKLAATNVPAGGGFVAGGARFLTPSAFSGRVAANQVSGPTDRLITPVGDGTFSFTIDVVAEVVGEVTAIRRGTKLVPDFAITGLITSYAEADFSGGADPESNADLVSRLRAGRASKSLAGAASIEAILRDSAELTNLIAVSSVGYGDPEQIRYRGLFPIAPGGRLDVYVRTASIPAVQALTKTAVAVGAGTVGTLWQVSIGRDEAPGFYEVTKILPTGTDPSSTTGYEPTTDTRGLDPSGPDYVPDVQTATEAAYSRYQTAVIRFEDPRSIEAVGATADYVVYVKALPEISLVQGLLSTPEVVPKGGDVVVRAAVPCDVGISLAIRSPANMPLPTSGEVSAAVAGAVNRTGFSGRLPASAVVAAVHTLLIPGQSVGPVELFGRIRRPDGTVTWSRSRDAILAPYEPERMVSAATLCFFVDPETVGVTYEVG